MTELAVIGMDAKFSGQNNIDRVERAFYQGASINTEDVINSTTQNLGAAAVLASVGLLAQSNKLNLADLVVLLITNEQVTNEQVTNEQVTDEIAADVNVEQDIAEKVKQRCLNCIKVTDLAAALSTTAELVKQQNGAVAIVGLNNAYSLENSTADSQAATISFDDTFTGYANVTGIASLLIASADFASNNHSYVYSNITGFAQLANNDELNADTIAATAQLALSQAQVSTEQVGLLEVSAAADIALSGTEVDGIVAAYSHDKTLHTALSCARSITGEGKSFSQVAGLLKCVISLQQRYIPALKDWQQASDSQMPAWQGSPFYMPVDARPWFPHADNSPHVAAYSCISQHAGTGYCHIVLQENVLQDNILQERVLPESVLQENQITSEEQKHPVSDVRSNGYFASSDLSLFIIQGDNEAQLRNQLDEIAGQLITTDLQQIAADCYARSLTRKVYNVVLIAESVSELDNEISLAFAGISKVFNDDSVNEWKTPKGSYFTATPANQDTENGSVAFLYPGIGATYVGLGRDLFHLFPQIYQPVAALADDIGASLKDTLLNPRSINRHSFKQLKQLDLDLRGNLANIAEAGVGFACVFTKVFEEVFAVKADFATGYSMGEVSMYAALGCWQQPGLMSARLAQSDTFNHRLCGELRTLRQHWGLDDVANGTFEQIWETYTIKATIEQVEVASADEDRVYCTIINTPDSLLLAGYPEACQRVIKNLGVRAMALNMANAIHSAPAYAEYDQMVELYHMDVTPRIKTKMYSSSCYLPIPQLSKAISHSIAKCLCDVVDFPRLVNTLHDKGARVFIEMGPGRSLCSWVDKILAHEDKDYGHVSVPVNAKGTSDELTYVRAIAKLISHGVNLKLDSLFAGSIVVQAGK